jgi:hypothetical protein
VSAAEHTPEFARRHPHVGRALKALFIAGGVGFFAGMAHFFWLADVSPTVPNMQTGQVVPLNQHGHVFYVHAWQHWLSERALLLSWGLALASGVIYKRLYTSFAGERTPTAVQWVLMVALIAAVAALPFTFFAP